MKKVARWYNSPEEAEADLREQRMRMTPTQRVEILLELIRRYYDPPERLERVARFVECKRR